MAITIKPIVSFEEIERIVDYQEIIWGLEPKNCIPANYLTTCVNTGGDLIGAYIDCNLVGFLLTLPCIDKKGKAYHHAHLLGIIPEKQGSFARISFQLMKYQYFLSLKKGINKVTCTFDPLVPTNAYFYIYYTGGIVENSYLNSFYDNGESINNIPTDRLLVTWHLKNKRVYKSEKSLGDKKRCEVLSKCKIINHDCKLDLSNLNSSKRHKYIAIEIPNTMHKVVPSQIRLILEHRLYYRKLFTHFLDKKYSIVDFITINNKGKKFFYIFKKTNTNYNEFIRTSF